MSSFLLEPHSETEDPLPRGEAVFRTRRQAYAELIRRHEAALLRAAARFCPGQPDYARDLVQETLVRGYEAFLDGRFQEDTNARAWLLKILTNYFLTNRRKQQRVVDVDMETLITEGAHRIEGLQAAAGDQPDKALLGSTLDERLEAALASLPDDLRVCVILVDIEELSYVEVAGMLQIPVGTVRSRLFRARRRLYVLLYDYAQEHRRV